MSEQPQYGLVMPFVTVASKGGPHDDNSYCAGFEMGRLDTVLSLAAGIATSVERVIKVENQPQADLIAMRQGYTATFTESEVDGWIHAMFEPAGGAE